MIQILYCGSSSACLELEGNTPYYAQGGYTVLLDGERRLRRDTNVFSLHGLKPDSKYDVTVSFDGGGEERHHHRQQGLVVCGLYPLLYGRSLGRL